MDPLSRDSMEVSPTWIRIVVLLLACLCAVVLMETPSFEELAKRFRSTSHTDWHSLNEMTGVCELVFTSKDHSSLLVTIPLNCRSTERKKVVCSSVNVFADQFAARSSDAKGIGIACKVTSERNENP